MSLLVPWSSKRSASTAWGSVIPKSTVSITASVGPMMIVEPPAAPATRTGLPDWTMMVGLIEERGRLPGWASLAVPGALKSVSSLFNNNPVPGATTALPNSCSIVHVTLTAPPLASTTSTWVVEPCGLKSAPAPSAVGPAGNEPG